MATIDRRGATVSAADPPIGTNPNPDLAIKAPVRAATTGSNINLQTIGLGTIDGVALAAGDRVLVKDQTDATTNGLYNASTGPWTRTIDANNNSQWTTGLQVAVTNGTVNQLSGWMVNTANPITLGTSAITFVALPLGGIMPAKTIKGNTQSSPAAAANLTGDQVESLLLFTQSGTGAVVRTVDSKLKDDLNVRDFRAAGDGVTDDTVALNAALAAAVAAGKTACFPAGTYMVQDTGAGAGAYCLLNTGASMRGEGRNTTIIAPLSGTSSGADILKCKPAAGNTDFWSIERLMISPALSGAAKGKRAIYMDFTASCALAQLHIADVYCTPGNDYSLYLDNNAAVNQQGVPSNSTIERSYFAEGVKGVSIGDSVTFRNCVFRGTAGSGRSGILGLVQTFSGATSSHIIVEQSNFDCPGAAIWFLNGRNVKIRDCNIESTFGIGSSSGAVVDIDGTSGTVVMPEIKGSHVSIFGTSTASHAIRVNSALECDIDNNTLLAGFTVADGILLTGNATNTYVGLNEIQSNFTTAVNNNGVGTRGVRIPLSLLNSFTNVGSGFAPAAYWQTKDGTVVMEGLLSCPATPNGLQICALSGLAAPAANHLFPAYALVTATVSPQAIQITSAGAVSYSGSNSASQVSLDGIVFATKTGVAGSS